MFLLSFVGCTAGMLTFTLQQSVCISTCPPEHEYYPLVFNNEATLGNLPAQNMSRHLKATPSISAGFPLAFFLWLLQPFWLFPARLKHRFRIATRPSTWQ